MQRPSLSPYEVEDVHREDGFASSCAADAREKKDALADCRLRVAAASTDRWRRVQMFHPSRSNEAAAHDGAKKRCSRTENPESMSSSRYLLCIAAAMTLQPAAAVWGERAAAAAAAAASSSSSGTTTAAAEAAAALDEERILLMYSLKNPRGGLKLL
jgi:hypothetical protein